ncbi:hypothetical protein IJ541_11505 [bacterium]|nr:hypothetical protein [bacterium]
MAPRVDLNPNLSNNLSLTGSTTLSANKNVFNNSLFTPCANNYDNDLLMSGMNFGQLPEIKTDTFQNSQNTAQTTFTSNPVEEQKTEKTKVEVPEQENAEDSVQEVQGSNIAKISGASLGFLAPIGGKLLELYKGGSFKELFKFKPLAITCTVLGVVGYGIGMLVDSLIDAKKAQKT